jgi:heptosyltransferase-2
VGIADQKQMNPSRLLVIRLSSLGDVVLTTPVLEALKSVWPKAHLTFLTKGAFAPVFKSHPQVDEIAVFEEKGLWGWAGEIRRRKFDVVIDLHGTFRSRLWAFVSGAPRRVRYDKRVGARRWLVWTKHVSSRLAGGVVDRYLETLLALGVPPAGRLPKLYVGSDERLSDPLERRLGAGPFIAVAPGALHATKRWLPERFAETAERLSEGRPVVLLGSAADGSAAEQVFQSLKSPAQNVVNQTTLREMMWVLQRSVLLLTNDSGAMHVAAALGVPTVAIFGPTVKPFGFFPVGAWASVIEARELDCRPCSLHGSATCPRGHFRCMKDVTVDQVVASAQTLLSSVPKGLS